MNPDAPNTIAIPTIPKHPKQPHPMGKSHDRVCGFGSLCPSTVIDLVVFALLVALAVIIPNLNKQSIVSESAFYACLGVEFFPCVTNRRLQG